MRVRAGGRVLLLLALAACARPSAAPGAVHRTIWSPAGPWVIHLLDVRLDRCLSAVAVKGAPGAVGRRTTSDLMRDLAGTRDVLGGVNADFFLFTPPGVPTNAHVSSGRVITPPIGKPAFAIDSAGVPRIATFTLPGFDSLVVDDPRLTRASLRPFHPLEAVGGRPILTRDSVITPDVDTEGQASFSRARHPRTAVGIADRGRQLLLLVVDGRQPGYSAGMTLRELGTLMLALGAPESLNLDGGGSTALVLALPDSATAFRAVNKPSDPTGERAVGNALAIVRGCVAR